MPTICPSRVRSPATGGFETPNFEFGAHYEVTGRSLLLFILSVEDRRAKFMRTGFGAVLDIIDTPMEGEV